MSRSRLRASASRARLVVLGQAEAFDYNKETTENFFSANVQRVAVDTSTGVHDELNSFQGGINNQKTHFFVYGNVAFESGSLVTVPGDANYQEYGFGYASARPSPSSTRSA